METMLSRAWWVLAVRGVIAVVFGLATFLWPGLTLAALVLLFGAYALVDGVFAVVTGIRQFGNKQRWWAVLIEGIVGIIAGVLTFVWPGITAVALLFVIAAWAIVTGVFEVIAAIRLRKEIEGEWLLGLSGIASIIFGLLLFIFPGSGLLTVVWLVGIYAIVFGVLMISLGFRARGRTSTFDSSAPKAV